MTDITTFNIREIFFTTFSNEAQPKWQHPFIVVQADTRKQYEEITSQLFHSFPISSNFHEVRFCSTENELKRIVAEQQLPEHHQRSVFIMITDSTPNKDLIMHSNYMSFFASNQRNFGITAVLFVKQVSECRPDVQENADVVVITSDSNQPEVMQKYVSVNQSFNSFSEMMQHNDGNVIFVSRSHVPGYNSAYIPFKLQAVNQTEHVQENIQAISEAFMQL